MLLELLRLFLSPTEQSDWEERVRRGGEGAPGYGHLKVRLVGSTWGRPPAPGPRERRAALLADPADRACVLAKGTERARARAVATRDRALRHCGLAEALGDWAARALVGVHGGPSMSANATNFLVRPLGFALGALVLCGACSSPKKPKTRPKRRRPPLRSPPTRRPGSSWPTTFQRECVLAAAKVEITGPKGLIDVWRSAGTRWTGASHRKRDARGPAHRREPASPSPDQTPIRAQLDGLVIVADEMLIVIESPTAEKLLIEATGDAYFRYVNSAARRRQPRAPCGSKATSSAMARLATFALALSSPDVASLRCAD